ncbi:hypothetical protein BU15DRAFT_79234 [Melanogaster broomeanus]|nr:hypothetical protein BU15DRAFT_79234 [Melanogaster broomeanus]
MDERNTRIREDLLQSGLYLADDTVLDHVQWRPNGRKNSLFINENSSQSSVDPQPELATLSAIVRVNDNNFWLTSDAGWRTPTKITPQLSDAKGTCIGIAPLTGIFHDDFLASIHNARTLQQRTATPDFEQPLPTLNSHSRL